MTKSKRKSRSKPKKKPELEKEQTEPLVVSVDTVIPESPKEEPLFSSADGDVLDKIYDLKHQDPIIIQKEEKPDNNGDGTKSINLSDKEASDLKKKIDEQPVTNDFVTSFDSITLQYVQLAAVCRDLPEPVLAPTTKEYGEHFYPRYMTAFQRIKKLLD